MALLNCFVQAYLLLNQKRNHVDHPAGPQLTILKSDRCDEGRDFPVEEKTRIAVVKVTGGFETKLD